MVRKSLPILVAALLAAGGVAALSLASGSSPSPVTGSAEPSTIAIPSVATTSGSEAAKLLAADPTPISFAQTGLAPSLPEILQSADSVDPTQAWRVDIPGDSRPAWIFAGTNTVAVVVPRTLITPDGTPIPGSATINSATAQTASTTGFALSQGGGGQTARTIVFLPPGASSPEIVQAGTSTIAADSAERVSRSGHVFVAQPRAR